MRPELTLIVPLRGRAEHLAVQLAWLARQRAQPEHAPWEVVLVEGDSASSGAEPASRFDWVRYLFVEQQGPFCKSQLLNRGLAHARGDFVTVLDVDLLPAAGVLQRQLRLARGCLECLVSGYRVMLSSQPVVEPLPAEADIAAQAWEDGTGALAPEDSPSATLKYLLRRERFGVCPFFRRSLLLEVGGWDEAYVGWGGEDQDLIHKLHASLTLLRGCDLLYFHMPHGADAGWRVPELTAANRRRFYSRKKQFDE